MGDHYLRREPAGADPVRLGHAATAPLARRALTKVPEITVIFWVLKLLTTGMGEAMSDFLGQKSVPIAGAIGIFGLWFALWLQLRQREYRAPIYWFAVMMVAIFGTMAADGVHDGASISYAVTTPLFAILVAAIFWRWYRSEGTLSIHSITTRRRERYYWAAVLATFALGTAAGDLTALSLNLGFWASVVLFASVDRDPGGRLVALRSSTRSSRSGSPTSSRGRSAPRSPTASASTATAASASATARSAVSRS